ncbi:SHOCT domain-containing protein [Streptomyces sp. MJP52]|uniref:SHOCT domain-containing protein n=1 Tax=Streptomyces sp. MJP52 TaxID=2940555 RepID=UPI0024739A3F|nr:SHOCT domain-containing protein [Streptomyces sp. MJP52]MDH6225196.1 putative membrane protein [Streptomyces sp. MJP52]
MDTPTHLAYDFPLLGALWTMFVFFLWVMWFALLLRIILDVFRDDGLSGWAKAGWLVLCTFVPFLGVFAYVMVRGKDMGRRERAQARARQEEYGEYLRAAVAASGGRAGGVDELVKLAEIRANGDITDEEFRRAKELVLSGHGPTASPGSAPRTTGS